MKLKLHNNLALGVLMLTVVSFCGFADITVKDIETAIIKQDYNQAKQIAAQLLSDNLVEDQKAEVQYYLGLCDLKLGRYAEAREIFTKLTKQPASENLRDKAYLGIFDSYYINENYEKALYSIDRLLKVSPKSEFLSLIHLKSARVNLKLTRWKEARQHLTKIVNEFPDSLEVHTAKQLLDEKQYFAVQVGAFIDRKRAEKLSDDLLQKGEYAYIVETVDAQNRTFYRVRVGKLVLLDNAQRLKIKLSKAGYPTQIYP